MAPAANGEPAVFGDEEREAGRLLFARGFDFLAGVAELSQLPGEFATEVAFAGRSNVGKSSLLNALAGRRALARTSNTPGRTRELNYFVSAAGVALVDMPGYGYARAEKAQVARWQRLARDYLRGRPNLRRVFILIDARHGVTGRDEEVLDRLDEAAVSYQIILTKADKLKPGAREVMVRRTAAALKRRPAAHPRIHLTSSVSGMGIADVRAEIAALAS